MNNMDEKKHTVSINVPEGYKLIDKGNGHYEVVKKEQMLPKTWEEFCKTHPIEGDKDCYISAIGDIITELHNPEERALRHPVTHRTTLPNRETAEAFIALMQLIQLRNFYNGDWEPDWKNDEIYKYVIVNDMDEVKILVNISTSHVLSFKSKKLATEFFENFRDLIEIAKPLI